MFDVRWRPLKCARLEQLLYAIASDPAEYANDFFDVTVGNNQAFASVPGYPATPGWDPVTGLGTPNAAPASFPIWSQPHTRSAGL